MNNKTVILEHKNSSKYPAKYSAFDTAVYYLGFKDRTIKEIKDKLLEKGFAETDIIDAIQKLMEYGYVDDVRYVRSYFRQNSAKKGSRLILNELKKKGVDKDIVISEASLFETDEKDTIDSIFNNRFSQYDLSDIKQNRRIVSYFLRRGFCYGDISVVIAKYRKNNQF